jgi:hypothetical protein
MRLAMCIMCGGWAPLRGVVVRLIHARDAGMIVLRNQVLAANVGPKPTFFVVRPPMDTWLIASGIRISLVNTRYQGVSYVAIVGGARDEERFLYRDRSDRR